MKTNKPKPTIKQNFTKRLPQTPPKPKNTKGEKKK